MLERQVILVYYFNPRPPRGERLWCLQHRCRSAGISIHAPREGSDRTHSISAERNGSFQSTPPARGATAFHALPAAACVFQSTPPARGATYTRRLYAKGLEFQSTPPARGATSRGTNGSAACRHFNPRPPRGERRIWSLLFYCDEHISIHAPREGSDKSISLDYQGIGIFQSTPPARGATLRQCKSYHTEAFQSTPPARGATCKLGLRRCYQFLFQSTPPARGATRLKASLIAGSANFNPRPPRGERHFTTDYYFFALFISIHAPREGSDHASIYLSSYRH